MEAVGLTGGIGSGKSTVARILLHLGYPVYIADTEASRLMNILPEIRFELIHHFGKSVYAPSGQLNKPVLSEIIFNNPEALATVNRIVHPRVMSDFQLWSSKQNKALVFFESAILFESGLNKCFDHIICVTAPEALRLQRVISRDKAQAKQVKKRMQNQMEESLKCKQSDFILYNDNAHLLIDQVLQIIKELEVKIQYK